jgi:hypothetical protein
MRRLINILSIAFIALVFSLAQVNAQCAADAQANACISKLQDGFTFLKTFKVDGQSGAKSKVEYSYVFSKDTQYFLNVCNDGPGTDGIIVTMYDSKRQMVSTNFNNGKFYPGLVYPCNATGIYYITFTFKDSQNHCGGSVLGFKR